MHLRRASNMLCGRSSGIHLGPSALARVSELALEGTVTRRAPRLLRGVNKIGQRNILPRAGQARRQLWRRGAKGHMKALISTQEATLRRSRLAAHGNVKPCLLGRRTCRASRT